MDQKPKWIKIKEMDQNQKMLKDTDIVVDVILNVPYDGIEHY